MRWPPSSPASFATYRDALTPDQRRQLSAATLFSPEVPIPLPALAAGQALGVEAPESDPPSDRLGLLDDWGEIAEAAHAAANPFPGRWRPGLSRPTGLGSPRPRCRRS